MEELGARLARLRCPGFLRPPSAEALGAQALRRPLLLWLHAVYADPSVRLAADDAWARADPSDADLERWLRSLGIADGAEVLGPQVALDKALEVLACAAESVCGRVLLEERGAAACMAESAQLLGDIAAHEASIFDSQCQIFPMSVQMQTAGSVDTVQRMEQLGEDIQSLERQGEALRNRVASAKERMDALRGAGTADSLPDPSVLSQELAAYLEESLALMERVSAMLNEDASCWADQTEPNLVGLGEASRLASERLHSLLSVFQDAEALAELTRSRSNKEQLADVLAHCQEAVNAVTPELRAQLGALEASVQLWASSPAHQK